MSRTLRNALITLASVAVIGLGINFLIRAIIAMHS